MTVSEALDTLRSEVPGCTLAAFADLSSRLVLSSSAASKPMQDELDKLSSAAAEALDGALADGTTSIWQKDGAEKPDTAMLITGQEARVFLRSPDNAAEALACVCAPDSDIAAVINSGREALQRIVAAT